MLIAEPMERVYRKTKEGLGHVKNGGRRLRLRQWLAGSLLSSGFLCLVLSVLTCGILFIKEDLRTGWTSQTDQFKWLVLVQGDPLDIDEVGRFLTQLEGVSAVKFISSQEVFDQIKSDPLFAKDFKDLGPQVIPASWEVKWIPSYLDRAANPELINEVKRLQGILDIAYDINTLNSIRSLRTRWLQVRLVLAAAFTLALLWAVGLLGRALFFRDASLWSVRGTAPLFSVLFVAWAAGAALVYWQLGPFPWIAFGGGVVVWGAAILIKNQTRS